MSSEMKKRPVKEVRLSGTGMNLSIWENEVNGHITLKATIERVYRLPPEERNGDGDNGYRQTKSFSAADLVFHRELSRIAIDWIREREEDLANKTKA